MPIGGIEMMDFDRISTDSPRRDSRRSRPRLVAMLAAATLATAIPVLIGTAPANASATAAATAASSTAAGDVPLWNYSSDNGSDPSICEGLGRYSIPDGDGAA